MRNRANILFVILLLINLSIFLYSTIGDWYNKAHASRTITEYSKAVELIDEADYERTMANAKTYNETLLKDKDRFEPKEEDTAYYKTLMNINGNDVMGYIEIPKIGVTLPIYHGTGKNALRAGVGHLEGSSLPIGGPSTHSVISGHRGLISAKLFTHLPDMEYGDIFFVHVLDQVLAYKVDNITTVLPDDMNDLRIIDGKDYCTLVTCVPYCVNTHRLLVRGERTEVSEQETDTGICI